MAAIPGFFIWVWVSSVYPISMPENDHIEFGNVYTPCIWNRNISFKKFSKGHWENLVKHIKTDLGLGVEYQGERFDVGYNFDHSEFCKIAKYLCRVESAIHECWVSVKRCRRCKQCEKTCGCSISIDVNLIKPFDFIRGDGSNEGVEIPPGFRSGKNDFSHILFHDLVHIKMYIGRKVVETGKTRFYGKLRGFLRVGDSSTDNLAKATNAIYCIFWPYTKEFYIGETIAECNGRFRQHMRAAFGKDRSEHLYRRWQQLGLHKALVFQMCNLDRNPPTKKGRLEIELTYIQNMNASLNTVGRKFERNSGDGSRPVRFCNLDRKQKSRDLIRVRRTKERVQNTWVGGQGTFSSGDCEWRNGDGWSNGGCFSEVTKCLGGQIGEGIEDFRRKVIAAIAAKPAWSQRRPGRVGVIEKVGRLPLKERVRIYTIGIRCLSGRSLGIFDSNFQTLGEKVGDMQWRGLRFSSPLFHLRRVTKGISSQIQDTFRGLYPKWNSGGVRDVRYEEGRRWQGPGAVFFNIEWSAKKSRCLNDIFDDLPAKTLKMGSFSTCQCNHPKYDNWPKCEGHVLARWSSLVEILGLGSILPEGWNVRSRLIPNVTKEVGNICKQLKTKLTSVFKMSKKTKAEREEMTKAFGNSVEQRASKETTIKSHSTPREDFFVDFKKGHRDLIYTPIDKAKDDGCFMCPVMYQKEYEVFIGKAGYVRAGPGKLKDYREKFGKLGDLLNHLPWSGLVSLSKHNFGILRLWVKAKCWNEGQPTAWSDLKFRPLVPYHQHHYRTVLRGVCRVLNFVHKKVFTGSCGVMEVPEARRKIQEFAHFCKCRGVEHLRNKTADIGNFFNCSPRVEAIGMARCAFMELGKKFRCKYVGTPKFFRLRDGSAPKDGLKPRFCNNTNNHNFMYFNVEQHRGAWDGECDVTRILAWDLEFCLARVGNSLFYQQEGFAQGSPSSPGFADLYAGGKEHYDVLSIPPVERDRFSRTNLRIRWMDDTDDWFVPGAERRNYGNLNFYGGKCKLEDTGDGEWAGLVQGCNGDGSIGFKALNKNETYIHENVTGLKTYRLVHGESYGRDSQKVGILMGNAARAAMCRGLEPELKADFALIFEEASRSGYSQANLRAAMKRMEERYGRLCPEEMIRHAGANNASAKKSHEREDRRWATAQIRALALEAFGR